jgi:cytochrome c biogenesis protein CcmG/thiol:disulfide interchange protein DsbE
VSGGNSRPRTLPWGAIAALAVIVLAVPISVTLRRGGREERAEPLRPGRTVPAVTLPSLDGPPFDLASLRGRPAVIHFWGSWCRPCTDELTVLAGARRRHPDLQVVGVVFHDEDDPARKAAAGAGADWPMLTDPDDGAARLFGVDSAPVTFVVADDGTVAGVFVGPVAPQALDRQLDRVL